MSKLTRLFVLTLYGKIYATTLDLEVMIGYMHQESAMIVTQEHLVNTTLEANPTAVYCVQWFDECDGHYSRCYHADIDCAVATLKQKKAYTSRPDNEGAGYSDVTIETIHLV
jgi:hypothetical protein